MDEDNAVAGVVGRMLAPVAKSVTGDFGGFVDLCEVSTKRGVRDP